MSGAKKHSTKKKAAAAVAVILLLLIAFGSTYAWKDYKQHKTNEFANSEPKYEAVLAEDFQEKENWRVSDGKIKKTISVTNTGIAENGFEAVYVRIQLKEYMEIIPLEWEETADRYMVDTDGKYIVFETEAAARKAYPYAPFDELKGGAYKILTDAVSGVTGWFIPTKEYDENGQYGKYVVTKYELGGKVTKVTGDDIDRADDDAQKNRKHDVVANGVDTVRSGECDYRKYIWEGTQIDGGVLINTAGNPTMEYIKWILDENVITLSEWVDLYEGMPVAMWIIDDTEGNDDPWIYWGQALLPGYQTSDFLNAVELIKQPGGNFYYAIHTEMQAVSLDELADGALDWPLSIVESYTRMRVDSVTVYDSDGQPVSTSSAIFIPEHDTEQEYAFTAVVEGENLKKGTVTWTIESQTGEDAAIGESDGKLKIPPNYKGKITVRATSDDDPAVYFEFTLIVGDPEDFGLIAEQGDDNNIKLTWDDSDLPDNEDGYGYTIYQSKDGGETWETRGANYGKQIKVLNVYPNKGWELKQWMESGTIWGAAGSNAGQGLISVDSIAFTSTTRESHSTVWTGSPFNVDPDSYLKDEEGKYKYDVIMFGSWDSYNYAGALSSAGVTAVEDFLKSGRGVLFGHDTYSIHAPFNISYLNLSNTPVKYSDVSTPVGAPNVIGSYRIQVANDGFLLQYPWSIAMNSILTVPFSHNGQVAKGTVWMKYVQVNGKFGVNDSSGALWGNGKAMGPEQADPVDGKGTNNHYLTTSNNTAKIQTGHSNGASTLDERKIIANTLMYLAQFTDATDAKDYSGRDMAPPDTPTAAYTDENKISISSFDNGSTYLYYVKAVDQTDPSKVYISNIVNQNCTTGLKGFFISEDNDPNGKPNVVRDGTGTITTALTIAAGDNQVVTYTSNTTSQYVHIIAVDKAGNLSTVKTVAKIIISIKNIETDGSIVHNATISNVASLNVDAIGLKLSAALTGSTSDDTVNWSVDTHAEAMGAGFSPSQGNTANLMIPPNYKGTIRVTAVSNKYANMASRSFNVNVAPIAELADAVRKDFYADGISWHILDVSNNNRLLMPTFPSNATSGFSTTYPSAYSIYANSVHKPVVDSWYANKIFGLRNYALAYQFANANGNEGAYTNYNAAMATTMNQAQARTGAGAPSNGTVSIAFMPSISDVNQYKGNFPTGVVQNLWVMLRSPGNAAGSKHTHIGGDAGSTVIGFVNYGGTAASPSYTRGILTFFWIRVTPNF